MSDISGELITRIERVEVHSPRPRDIGFNSRKGAHGTVVQDSVVHVASGAVGVGWSRLERGDAESLVGRRLGELFRLPDGSLGEGVAIDLPLWDLAARLQGVPLYRLLGARGSRAVELYDGSIYIDDLDADDAQARAIFREEVRTGHRYGYLNFRIKIGRGARWMPTAAGLERETSFGLSDDELAFYDALETNDSAVQVLDDETLRDIARELVDTVRSSVTIDWTLRENVRANLRRLVKRILRKHGYPPDKQEKATQTVLEQAEVLSAGWAA